ncbi:hypothetical protein VRU48_05685 [Pedobacter sp. KR3-3]|uniref:Lipoprotein n=1 Tax=Pedobacter albus TaxID=3113905 RepID=A0ABU7I5Q6_9SPHI|nr:hypothetical protein [Pedobacter sp. KR3-3]MEE1944589.1 hypothetical protein [Pedobacter sp. KR3-3]
MKKLILIFIVSLAFLQCKVFHRTQNNAFKVYRIDSIQSYYLIYAQKGELRYKIVSKKVDNECKSIKVNGLYAFDIHSMSQVNGVSTIPSASKYEVSGMAVDNTTTINVENETQWDLFYADNIAGLCFKNKK